MNSDRDMLDAIRRAGEVPPPPDREGAFARAMQAAEPAPLVRHRRRGFVLLVAAALVLVPAAVFAAVGHYSKPKAPAPAHRPAIEAPAPQSHGTPTPRSHGSATETNQPTPSGSTDDRDQGHSGDGGTDAGDDADDTNDSGTESTQQDGSNATESPDAEVTPTETAGGTGDVRDDSPAESSPAPDASDTASPEPAD